MAQATSAARRPTLAPTPTPSASNDSSRKTPLDRIFSRLKLAQRYLLKSHEELALFQAREPADGQARPLLGQLAKSIDLEKTFNGGIELCEKLYKIGWKPKGSIVAPRFKAGDAVQILEDKRHNFLKHGLYSADIIGSVAKVEKVSGNQAVIKFKDGTTIAPITAGWLEAVQV